MSTGLRNLGWALGNTVQLTIVDLPAIENGENQRLVAIQMSLHRARWILLRGDESHLTVWKKDAVIRETSNPDTAHVRMFG